jgi:hypothetical protein
MNKQTKQSLVWGGLFILIGLMALGETFTDLGPWIWVGGLAVAGTGVYALYSTDKSEKWMLVVSYALETVAALIALLTLKILPAALIPTFVLLNIAIPFLIIYFQGDRKKWGLLIPVYILVAVSVMVPMIIKGFLDGILVAAYVLFAVAIPFFVVYFRNSKNWWALIPGIITAIVGFSFLIAENRLKYIAPIGLIIAGIWLTTRTFIQRSGKIESQENNQ